MQLHRPYQPAPFALVVSPIPSSIARPPLSGTNQPPPIVTKTRADVSSTPKEAFYAPTGNALRVATSPHTAPATSARVAESTITELRSALEQRKIKANTPYKPDAWREQLAKANLINLYPDLPEQLERGFSAGVKPINTTFTPPNKPSVQTHAAAFQLCIQTEFERARYIGPFSRAEIESLLGPFQSSPLSIIPKPGKPGKFRLIQNLSFPHVPRNNISSINSAIDSNLFPCTWGTFSVVSHLIWQLPPLSQAAVRDIKEAYRTIPLAPSQWPGLVVRLGNEDSFAIDTCNCFGLASGCGCYGIVGDAGAQLMRVRGLGPITKWVDDHLFIRIHIRYIQEYNERRRNWAADIVEKGGRKQNGGRLWFEGQTMPNGHQHEFDEDCSTPIRLFPGKTPRRGNDASYPYCMADIDEISDELGIPWEKEKDIPFSTEVPFAGFSWDLETRTVRIPTNKREKYLDAIFSWERSTKHTLEEVQKLYGKLLHACQVVPAGRAYLTNLEKFMAIFGNRPFMPHTQPRSTKDDLLWWKRKLSQTTIIRPIPGPCPIWDIAAFSDASSEVGIGIVINGRWRAWRLIPGWKSEGRDIGWAEAIGFLFLITTILAEYHSQKHYKVYGDNQGVVEGWWKGRSRNSPTNEVFKLVHAICESAESSFLTRYVPSKHNPADDPSRGIYGPRNLLLPPIPIPTEFKRLVVDFDSETQEVEYRNGRHLRPLPKPVPTPSLRERAVTNAELERQAEELFAQAENWQF